MSGIGVPLKIDLTRRKSLCSNVGTLLPVRESRESFDSDILSLNRRSSSVISRASERRSSITSVKSSSGVSRKLSFKSLLSKSSSEDPEEGGQEMRRSGSMRREASVR